MVKHNYWKSPRKGTKARQLLIALLSERGLTARESIGRGLTTVGGAFVAQMQRFEDDYGWDVRAFDLRPNPRVGPQIGRGRRCERVYRIVGKRTWDGRYRALNERCPTYYREELDEARLWVRKEDG